MEAQSTVLIPRVAIKFCTQCKWNLRAAYYAQELLQTFSTTLGEISLQPSTNGIFTIILYHQQASPSDSSDPKPSVTETLIWDRKRDTGFPETKELKNRIRNVIDPDRDMGHIDRSLKKGQSEEMKSAEKGVEEEKPQAMGGESLTFGESLQGKTPDSGLVDLKKTTEPQAMGGESLTFGESVQGKTLSSGLVEPETEKEPEAMGGENLSFGENVQGKASGPAPVDLNRKKETEATGGESLSFGENVQGRVSDLGLLKSKREEEVVSQREIDPSTGKPKVECEDCN